MKLLSELNNFPDTTTPLPGFLTYQNGTYKFIGPRSCVITIGLDMIFIETLNQKISLYSLGKVLVFITTNNVNRKYLTDKVKLVIDPIRWINLVIENDNLTIDDMLIR